MGELIAMPQSRPMPTIGKSCYELRIVDAGKTWRIMYCIHPQAVVVLNIFAKTTPQTPNDAINLSKQRLAEFTAIADN